MQRFREAGRRVPLRFDGKVSVVTGGASGIGEGIVRHLVAEGGRCLIADVQEERGHALARVAGSDRTRTPQPSTLSWG
jgi:NAD(P)-dependent dehydrogenase (short-subunit alcohol dehydrogenase family)